MGGIHHHKCVNRRNSVEESSDTIETIALLAFLHKLI